MYKIALKTKIICLILSGGLSSRMKAHKAFLPFSANQNFLQHIIQVYLEAGINNIIVVKNKEMDLTGMEIDNNSCLIVNNCYPEKGRLYSIQLGLSVAPDADYCYIQNIDSPFVTQELIKQLAACKTCAGYVSPYYNGMGGHPVLISSDILKRIETITDYNITLREVLGEYPRYKLITQDEKCTRNINTKEEYEQYFPCTKNAVKP